MSTHEPKITVNVSFRCDYDLPVSQFRALQNVLEGLTDMATVTVQVEDATPPPASPEPSKRPRGRPPAASPLRPPPAQDQPLHAEAGNGTDDDFLIPPGAVAAEATLDPDDEDALGLSPAGRTGLEALEQGLGGVRNLFNANHKAVVKEIQTAFGVAKFSDIEPKDGHKLLRLVEAAAQKVGMRV
jgi:hypothetical protein